MQLTHPEQLRNSGRPLLTTTKSPRDRKFAQTAKKPIRSHRSLCSEPPEPFFRHLDCGSQSARLLVALPTLSSPGEKPQTPQNDTLPGALLVPLLPSCASRDGFGRPKPLRPQPWHGQLPITLFNYLVPK